MFQTTLCYLEQNGKWLMLHRVKKENDLNEGKWVGIGGKFEEGESPEECLIREVREETGLTVNSWNYRGIITFVSDKWGTEYMHLFHSDDFSGEMHPCDEGVAEWVDIDRVLDLNLWEGDRIFLRYLLKDIPFFSLKLMYEGDDLVKAVLNGKELETAWWKRTVVYQIYPKSFCDTTGSGTGDLEGIIRHLDHLKELGAGAVWITPFYPSPNVDNGYDISDYTAIDPACGTMEDFDRLVSEAGKRNIRIVMDLVFNHSSDRHPWFLESKKDRTNPRADWYIWRDPKEGTVIPEDGTAPEGGEPTNWRGIFGGSAWTWCAERRQYYFHTFAKEQPDLDWENPAVRQALYDAANFWLDRGAGGFRIDAISYIKKPAELLDGTPDSPDGTVSVHAMTANTPGILDFLREFRREAFDGRDIFTVGEANGVPAEELKDWVGDEGVFSMLFEFSHVLLPFDGPEIWCRPQPWKLTKLKKALDDSQEAVRDQGWLPVYFENHDRARSADFFFEQPFAVSRAGSAAEGGDIGADDAAGAPSFELRKLRAKALAAVLLTLRGTPFVYQGEELGMPDMDWKDPSQFNDLSTLWQYENALREGFSPEEALRFTAFFSRDNARTPMQWSGEKNAGFTCGNPWLPVHEDYPRRNAAAEEADPDSVLHWYRKLAALRSEREELISGSFQDLLPDSEDIFCFARSFGGSTVITAVNFIGREVELPLEHDPEQSRKLLLSSRNDTVPGILGPYEAKIFLS